MEGRIHILEGGEDAAATMRRRYPYWAEGWDERGDGSVGLVGFGASGELAELLEGGEGEEVGRWVMAECYDEWSPRLAKAARERPGLVGWRPPDSLAAKGRGNADGPSRELLILVDGTSRHFWSTEILGRWRGQGRDLEPVVLDVEGQKDWERAKERIARARVCLSWLGDAQVEQWLYRWAAGVRMAAWVSVNASGGPNLRHLGDKSSGLRFASSGSLRRLRSMFRVLDELDGLGGAMEPAWDDSWRGNAGLVRWVAEHRAGARSSALVGREAGEEREGGFARRLALDAVVETVNAIVEASAAQPLTRVAASRWGGGSLEALFRCHPSREWAEALVYLSYRRAGLWEEAMAGAKRLEATEGAWGERIRVGIGCALLEKLSLEGVGYDRQEALRALEILEAALRGSGSPCADLAAGVGMAAILADREDLVEGLAGRLAASGGDVAQFYRLIGEHLRRTGRYGEALDWLERGLRRMERSSWADAQAIDLLCLLGEWREALRRAERACDVPEALARFATFRLRPGRRCRLLSREIGGEESQLCLSALERLEADSPPLARARAIHVAMLGRGREAEAACRAVASLAREDWEALARLRLDFAGMGLPLPVAMELGEWEGKVDRLEQVLQLALLAAWEDDVALAERVAALMGTRKRLEAWAQKSVSDLQGVCELRDDVIYFGRAWGWDQALGGEALERRLVAKHGRSLAGRHLSAWDGPSGAAREVLGHLKLAGQLAISALEPRFLDV